MKARMIVLALSGLLASSAQAQLNDAGFDTGSPAVGGTPFPVGQWAFDNCAFVGPTSGITPFSGPRMLQFINTAPGGPSGLVSCDVVQIVDVTSPTMQAMIAPGTGVAGGTVLVNRVGQNAAGTVDTGFGLLLYAFATLGDAQNLNSPLATMSQGLISDNNPATWEPIAVSLNLPAATQYIGFRLGANENVLNNGSGVEFDGHFADQADLRVIPTPSALALLGLGGVCLTRRRRMN
ncbi:hypothetical protein PHYC_00300 [Phycisphaerales bacterium]|nr:hypothetical protein PHYC_00300 [Phycisphaerales bacterium]